MYFFSFLTSIFSIITNNGNRFIKNGDLQICKNCKYFIPSEYAGAPQLSKCNKFGIMDIIDGEILYEYADQCRIDNDKCGENASYFENGNFSNMELHAMINMIIE